MPTLLQAFAANLLMTPQYVHLRDLPPTTRHPEVIWQAHDAANLALRQPLYHRRLGKPRPKPKAYETAVQQGLAVLAAFAMATNTRQIIVRLLDGEREAISMQPRLFGVNWVRRYGISPENLWDSQSDPLPTPAPGVHPPAGMAAELSTRGVMHLAGKTALAVQLCEPDCSPHGTATFVFQNGFPAPRAHVVFRPLEANRPARTVVLAHM